MAPLASISARVWVKSPRQRLERVTAAARACGTRSPVDRSASVPVDAVAHRRPAVLVDPPRVVHGQRLAGVEAGGQRMDQRERERRHAVHVVDAGLRVGRAQLERPVGRVQAQLEPPAARVGHRVRALTPRQRVGEPLPRFDRGRHALALQSDRDRRADRGQARVASGMEGRVGGQRRQLGEMRAQGVVDGQRAVGAAERHVQVQPADELAARAVAVFVQGAQVARVVGELAELGGGRVRARGHQPPERRRRGREVAPGGPQRVDRARDVRARRRDDLQLRGRQLELEARVVGHAVEHLARVREQVQRLAVEQEQLLLEPDPELVRGVEARPQGVGVHVAQPPASRSENGPPWWS